MNLQCSKPLAPLRVLIVNPLASSSQLIAVKILSGRVFGEDQSINLTLLVFSNEVPAAEAFKLELEKCAYSCANYIGVSSNVPSVTDADVFCFLANFPNPNYVDFEKIETDEQFDNLYLVLKIANNFEWPDPPTVKADDDNPISIKQRMRMDQEDKPKPVKPIFMADGLVLMDIIHSISKNMPRDLLFCPTPLTAIAKKVIGDHIKVQCNAFNDVFVWAADDVTFHMEVARPLLRQTDEAMGPCDWDLAGKRVLDTLNMGHTQFNATWMKKDCIEKMKLASKRNPYGSIYRAASFAQALHTVWLSRRPRCGDGTKVLSSMGVISDGSLDTHKGLPYTLPVVFAGDGWTVNECFNEDTHLMQEIKRINKAAKQNHARMLTHCQNFLKENVIKMAFVPSAGDTPSYTLGSSSSRSSI